MAFLDVVKPKIDQLINDNNGGQDGRLEKSIRIFMQGLAFLLLLVNMAGNIKELFFKKNCFTCILFCFSNFFI